MEKFISKNEVIGLREAQRSGAHQLSLASLRMRSTKEIFF